MNVENIEKSNPCNESRRDFLKLCAAIPIPLVLPDILEGFRSKEKVTGTQNEKMQLYRIGKKTPSICTYCAGGCGVLVTSIDGKAIEIEGDPSHPINKGALCSKPSAYIQLANSDRRLLTPLMRTNPNKGQDQDPGWVPISWDEALKIIAEKVNAAIADSVYKHQESIGGTTVESYYRVGKDSPIGWLGSSYWNNEECYLAKKMVSILGSMNIEHQARKCHASTVAALANTFGFGAMTNHVIDAKNSNCFLIVSNPAESHTMEFKWVMQAVDKGAKVINLDPRYHRTSAKADIYGKYRSGAEAAIFLGLIRLLLHEKTQYTDWDFLENRTNAPYDLEGNKLDDWKTNNNSIFGKLKAQVAKYTPAEVERISGLSQAKLVEVADTFFANKPSNIYYSMGTTQHTNATQTIRAQATLQLCLGNMGVPGGGVNALRGISNVQGSTDMNLLSHLVMGYRTTPRNVDDVRRYQKWKNTSPADRGGVEGGVTYEPKDKIEERWDGRHFGTWKNLEYNWGLFVGTYPGADPDNEPVVCDLPIGNGNAIVQLFREVKAGKIKVMLIGGENPAVSVANAGLVRDALSREGLFTVVYELFETETAHYADILLPGTTVIEREGSITNTGRWVQWRWKATEPPGQCREELWVLTQLFKTIRVGGFKTPSELSGLPIGKNPEDTWPSFYTDELGETSEAVYKEIGHPTFWTNVLYRGSWNDSLRPDLGGVLAKRRDNRPVSEQDEMYGFYKNWAWSWMGNQRILYNINEDPPGLSTFFVWWAHNENVWLGLDHAAIWSRHLYNPAKEDWNPFKYGMPLHNEPLESPDTSLASEYPSMWDNRFDVVVGSPNEYPHVLTTFRLAEHMQAGALTRNLPWLVECHPEVFVEMSHELASEIGVETGDYVFVKSARKPDGIKVKAIATDRMKPLTVNGKTVHEVAMPWHWGFKGLSTGPSANLVTIDAVDVSANIPETKACLVKVEKA